jgi:hypothetical protein
MNTRWFGRRSGGHDPRCRSRIAAIAIVSVALGATKARIDPSAPLGPPQAVADQVNQGEQVDSRCDLAQRPVLAPGIAGDPESALHKARVDIKECRASTKRQGASAGPNGEQLQQRNEPIGSEAVTLELFGMIRGFSHGLSRQRMLLTITCYTTIADNIGPERYSPERRRRLDCFP